MRWQRGHTSPDVIDRRGTGGAGLGGLLHLLPLLMRSPWGWLIGLLLIGGYLLSQRVSTEPSDRAAEERAPAVQSQERGESELVQFVSFVLDDVQGVWRNKLRQQGRAYQNAKLVLFTDQTSSGCGFGLAASGPFYCPGDARVYIDLGFYRDLERRFGAPGDFAQAYVIAHEIGHHVQNLAGTTDKVHRASSSEREGADGLSVRLELQADCFAGVWAHSTAQRELLERGDLEEGLGAAAAVGDDRIQRQGRGTVNPETWTHGSSEQRSRWFRRGYSKGNPGDCDTFSASQL